MLAMFAPAPLEADDVPAESAADTMSFHRVYVPADRIDRWPRGAVRYVPMDRAAFERTVAEIAAEARSPASREARVDAAVYTVRYDADGMLRGRGELTVRHSSARGVLLDLGACDLSIARPTWAESGDDAVLGVDATGRLKLLVERSATLRFDFTVACAAQAGQCVADVAVPCGMATRWLVDVPREITPSVDVGLLEPVDAVAPPADRTAAAADGAASPASQPNEDANQMRRVWKIELGKAGRLGLKLNAERPPGEHAVADRDTTEYTIAPDGLAIASSITLDVYEAPLAQLALRVDADATLLGARLNGKAAQLVEGPAEASGERTIRVAFAEPVIGAGQVLTIDAMAPLRTGERWRLPRIALVGMAWREASSRIVVEPPLRIERLWPTDAALTAAASPREANYKHFTASAALDVAVDWIPRNVRAQAATLLDLGGEARGVLSLDVVFSEATAATLSGAIAPGWSVESVASTPPEAIADWRVDSGDRQRGRIVVECRPGVSRRAKIVAAVRWRESPEQRPLTTRDLRIVDWGASCAVTRSLVSVAAAQSYQLTTRGDHRLPALETDDETAHELLSGHNGQLRFDLDAATPGLTIATHRAATPYRGEVSVELDCSAGKVHETYRLRCTPQGDGLTRLVVRIAPPGKEEIAWTIGDSAAKPISARRLSDDEARAYLIEPGNEVWVLTLDQPRSATFEVVGNRARPFGDRLAAPLAALHDADAQDGRLTVRGDAAMSLRVENQRLKAIPRGPQAATEFDDVRASYRYVPTRDVSATEPAAMLSRAAGETSAAVAYSCRNTARLRQDGRIEHRAEYAIENLGRRDIAVALGPNTVHFEARLDGEIVARGGEGEQTLRVRLPAGLRFATLVVDYAVQGPAIGWIGSTALQGPVVDVPVLRREWRLLVPESLDVVGADTIAGRKASWSERWFGPLARPADEPPFDPTSWRSWVGKSPRRMDRAEASDATLALFDRLAKSLPTRRDAGVATWSSWLTQGDSGDLFVDAAALERSNVRPWTPLPPAARGGRSRVAEMLSNADLAIVTDGERFALTSVAVADHLAGASPLELTGLATTQATAYWLPSLGDDATGRQAAANPAPALRNPFDDETLIATPDWSAAAAAFVVPWSGATGSGADEHAWRGWRRIDLRETGGEVSLTFVNVDAVGVAAWAGFLVAAGLAWSLARRRAAVVAGLAFAAVAALLLFDDWLVFAPIVSGVWWGLCVGAALGRFPSPRLPKRQNADASSAASWRWKSAATAGLLLVIVLVAVRSWADDAPMKATGVARMPSTIYRVFFPVDEKQQPAGDRVYVPEPLFAKLERWNLDRQRGPQGAIVASAVQRIRLEWNIDGTSLEPRSATTVVDLHTFDDDALVAFALPAGDAEPTAIRLDGGLLDADQFAIDEGRLSIAIAKAGTHRVELTTAPKAAEQAGRIGVDITPIAAATSRLEIEAPENGPEIELLAASGNEPVVHGRGPLAAPLKGDDAYRIAWSKSPAREAGQNIESSERLWLDVAPGAVTMTADVTVRDVGGLPDELRIAVDPQLIPLSATVDGNATPWRRTGSSGDQLAIRLAGGESLSRRLIVRFLVRSATGVGILRLPRWEPQVSSVQRRWLAVNIDPALEREIAAGPEAQPMNVEDFIEGDEKATAPDYAYRLARGELLWTLTTRRTATNLRIDQSTTVVAEAGRVGVVIDGDVTVRSGDVLEHVLRCDERLKIDRVVVVEDAADRVAFWTQSSDGIVQVFLNRKAGPSQRLRVEGHVDIRGDGPAAEGLVTIGEFALQGAKRVGQRLRIHRMPSATVSVGDLANWTERNGDAATSAANAPPASGASTLQPFSPPTAARLVRDLVAAADAMPVATLGVKRNAPHVDATAMVIVDTVEPNAWSLRAEFRGEVTDGLCDDLMFDLPGDWVGELAVDPPMPTTLLDAPGGGRRLLVRPVLPLRGRFALSIRGQIRPPTNRTAPRWRLLDADTMREFFVLPTLWQGRRLGWDVTQLRRTAAENGFALPRRDGALYQTFQVVGQRAAATLQAEVPSSRTLDAYVDVVAAELNGDQRAVLATYDLLPSGVSSCRLSLGEAAKLVWVVLEDRLATPVADGDQTWRIDLESDSLPQRLQVLTISDVDAASSDTAWTAPRLEGATIRRTTWTVATARGATRADRKRAAATSVEQTGIAQRVRAHEQLWLAAANAASEYKTTVAPRWERRLAAAWAEQHIVAGAGDEPAAADGSDGASAATTRWHYVIVPHGHAAAATTAAQQFAARRWGEFADDVVFEVSQAQAARFADQLTRSGVSSAAVVASPPRVVERGAFFRRILDGARVATYTDDDALWTWSPPPVRREPPPLGRWAMAVVIAALAVLLIRRNARSVFAESAARHPHLVLAASGVLWWLWLWPGWVGWALIGASVVWAWRLTWPLPKLVGRARPSSYS